MAEKVKKSQQRKDLGIFWFDNEAEEDEFGFTKKAEKTDEGYLKATAIATGVGVFTYYTDDGIEIKEYRSREEVFNPDSVASLQMKPFTNDHPDEQVSPENVKKYQVGSVGETIQADGMNLSVPLIITDEQAVQDAENGKRALSCGYTADVVMQSGVWQGIQYDAIQKNIRYNHLALVDAGRAGDKARIRFDSATKRIPNTDGQDGQNKQKEPNNMGVRKFTCDGVEAEACDYTINYVKKQDTAVVNLTAEVKNEKARADKAEAGQAEIQGKLDELQGKFDAQAEQLKKAEEAKLDEAQIAQRVKDRAELMKTAESFKVELKGDESDLDIKKAVILSVSPDAKLDKASEGYIQGRFDTYVEQKKSDDADDAENVEKLDSTQGGGSVNKGDQAEKDFLDKVKNSWKGGE